ncbi:MAG: hypothetical protein AB7S74_17870 [Hyphomicrobium sp.]
MAKLYPMRIMPRDIMGNGTSAATMRVCQTIKDLTNGLVFRE